MAVSTRRFFILAAVMAAFSFSTPAQLVRPGLIDDKPVMRLTAVFALADIGDGISTKHWERDPLAHENGPYRFLLGPRPTAPRMALLGTAETIGFAILAHQMHQSRHKWIRRTWWVPQTFAMSWHAGAIVHNYRSY